MTLYSLRFERTTIKCLVNELITGFHCQKAFDIIKIINKSNLSSTPLSFKIIYFLQNIVELLPKVSEVIVTRTLLLDWLKNSISPKKTLVCRRKSADLLCLFVHTSTHIQKTLGLRGGIYHLLKCLTAYNNKTITSLDGKEKDYIYSVFNTLISALSIPHNRLLVLECEGLDLILIILKRCHFWSASALRTVALVTTECRIASERWVNIMGLKSTFAYYAKKLDHDVANNHDPQKQELIQLSISIIFNLISNLAQGHTRDRLYHKFFEAGFHNFERLVELLVIFQKKLMCLEKDTSLIQSETVSLSLQQSAIVIAHVCFPKKIETKKRLMSLLFRHHESIGTIRNILIEYCADSGLKNYTNPNSRYNARNLQIKKLIRSIGKLQSVLKVST
jgi:hypothetical protein